MDIRKQFKFEKFTFDNKSRKLVNEEKEEILLTPRTAEVLVALLTNAGEIVEKEYFFDTVWEGTDVEVGNLAVVITSLRKAFRELGDNSAIIKTVSKRGYKFVSNVEIVEKPVENSFVKELAKEKSKSSESNEKTQSEASDTEGTNSNRSHTNRSRYRRLLYTYKFLVILFIVITLASIIGIYTYKPLKKVPKQEVKLVVLPFTNLTTANNKYDLLGYAIADRLISDFGRFEDVKTLPIWNTIRYKDAETSLEDDTLKSVADYIITGNYSSKDENITVSVRLIRTADWQIMFDTSVNVDEDQSLIDIRDSVVQNIKVATTMFESPKTELHKLKTGEIEDAAYFQYLQGLEHYTEDELEKALMNFEKAVELSPDFANAWLMISRAHFIIGLISFGGTSYVKKSEDALEKALLLEPDNIYFKLDKAELYIYLNRFVAAYNIYRDLSKENSDEPGLFRSKAEIYMYLGLLDKSVQEIEKYLEALPHERYTFTQFIYVGQYDRFEEVMYFSEKSAFSVFYKGYVKLYKGEKQEAIAYFDRSYELSKDSLPAQNAKVFSYILKGQPKEAKKILDTIESKIKDQNVIYKEGLYRIVQAHAMLGEKEAALQTLEETIESGFLPFEYFERDPFIENIRDTSEFERLMEIARMKQASFIKSVGLEK